MYQFHRKYITITKRLKTPEEVEKYFPGFIVFTDCTEQQIPRPEDKNKRKMYYSGKKKRHTVKNQLTVNKDGYILHKATHKEWRRHDYDVYKKNHPVTPKQVLNVHDLGYLGVKMISQNNYRHLPHKKNRNQNIYPKKKKNITQSIQKRG